MLEKMKESQCLRENLEWSKDKTHSPARRGHQRGYSAEEAAGSSPLARRHYGSIIITAAASYKDLAQPQPSSLKA